MKNSIKFKLQPHEEQFLPAKTTFFDPRLLPEHHTTPTYNPQAIQTHYQHPAMAHAMVKFETFFKKSIPNALILNRTGVEAMMTVT